MRTIATRITDAWRSDLPCCSENITRGFIVVTDEDENESCQGMRFEQMFATYRETCFPATVTFISFIGQNAKGQMVSALELKNLPYRQFRMDAQRPDLTRLDSILGEMALTNPVFTEQVGALAERLRQMGGRIGDARLTV